MNHPLATLFEQFLREQTYLKNVTPRMLVWYRELKNYTADLGADALSSKASLQQFVIALRQRNIRPISDASGCARKIA